MEQDGAFGGAHVSNSKEQRGAGEEEQKGAPHGDGRGHGRPDRESERKGPA